MLYCFKNLLMLRKRVAHGSSPSIKRRIPCVFCFLQCKEQKVELNCWSRKSISLCLYFHLCCNCSSNQCKITSVILTGHLSLLSLTVSVNALYNLAALSGFMSFSAPHLQLINLPVLPIPAICLTSQEEWGDGKLERHCSKGNIKISLEILTLGSSWKTSSRAAEGLALVTFKT